MEIKTRHYIALAAGFFIILADFLLFFGKPSRFFEPLIAVGVVVAASQFWIDFLRENNRQKEIEIKFLEFVRALVETVKSGIPIPKAIMQVSRADYGSLTPYVRKLAHHIEWGMPLRESLKIFAETTENKVILRSVAIVIEAERSGGNIDEVLRAVSNSVAQIKKIKDERRTDTYSQMVQGYFIFFIFIAIMLITQIYLLPQLGDITLTVSSGLGGVFSGNIESISGSETPAKQILNFENIFLGLILIQGFFAGIMIGKFAEGNAKMGLRHSAVLVVVSYLVITFFRGG
ncbi:type II secretion system F family protein [Candidatus Woesearchaeota archaeon]|nr:type II secretion system F family protein [Candidatus Woesearchaeota archaeon]